MFKINYSEDSLNSVYEFISNLKDYYKKIYFDTWLVNEDQIVLWYVEKTDKLFDEIIDKIEDNIDKWVFWVVLDNKFKLTIKVRSYSIIIIIKRNTEVYIEEILFT